LLSISAKLFQTSFVYTTAAGGARWKAGEGTGGSWTIRSFFLAQPAALLIGTVDPAIGNKGSGLQTPLLHFLFSPLRCPASRLMTRHCFYQFFLATQTRQGLPRTLWEVSRIRCVSEIHPVDPKLEFCPHSPSPSRIPDDSWHMGFGAVGPCSPFLRSFRSGSECTLFMFIFRNLSIFLHRIIYYDICISSYTISYTHLVQNPNKSFPSELYYISLIWSGNRLLMFFLSLVCVFYTLY